MNAAGRLYPLARWPLLAPAEYATLLGVSERHVRAILARLGADGLVGVVHAPSEGPGRPAHLAYLTAHGVAALTRLHHPLRYRWHRKLWLLATGYCDTATPVNT